MQNEHREKKKILMIVIFVLHYICMKCINPYLKVRGALQNIRIEVDTRDLFVDRPFTNIVSSEQIEQSV